MRIVPPTVHQLIVAIYDAALDPRRWKETLEGLVVVFGGDSGCFLSHDVATDAIEFMHTAPISAERRTRCVEYFKRKWRLAAGWPPNFGEVVCNGVLVGREETTHAGNSNASLTPRGAERMLCLMTRCDRAAMCGVMIHRGPTAAPFDDDDVAAARDLMPHLQRALRMAGALRARHASASLGELARLYALTHAEARVLGALVDGQSIAGYCAIAGISVNTAKTHLKQIFAKTGVNRQTELIRMALTNLSSAGSYPGRLDLGRPNGGTMPRSCAPRVQREAR